ncbi:DUF397 domain-containing protein [Streptomyces fuscichromogenes]|uniref:DUF397 domain-containing protein n=1 Tax=Streptomyces fuscichromogenes TaxID=1324013 RepID=A0A917UI80_9ACTN|nr:DUF397 domain-containing protein [Streptomyces fuscichromogenes]GGM90844.1 hypothetical protein GCM10011578_008440 [Streptomyces fuscichromogenes]
MPVVGGVTEEPRWFKSSHSGANETECLEAAFGRIGVLIRDSKRPAGPHLSVSTATWSRFVADVVE